MSIYAAPLQSFSNNLHLYLDPGAGSMLLQLAIAAVLGLAILIRTQWSRIKKLYGKSTQENDGEDEKDE